MDDVFCFRFNIGNLKSDYWITNYTEKANGDVMMFEIENVCVKGIVLYYPNLDKERLGLF